VNQNTKLKKLEFLNILKIFFKSNGFGTVAIVIDGSQEENKSLDFVKLVLENLDSFLNSKTISLLLLIHKADIDGVVTMDKFKVVLESKLASKMINYIILYTSTLINGTMQIAFNWLMQYGPSYRADYEMKCVK